MKAKEKTSELMGLLNSRKAWDLPEPYSYPTLDRPMLHRIAKTVQCMRETDTSDAFIGPRTRLYLMQGYDLPSDLLRECTSRKTQRDREKRVIPGALEKKKRELDEDRAWNQFRSAQYAKEVKAA